MRKRSIRPSGELLIDRNLIRVRSRSALPARAARMILLVCTLHAIFAGVSTLHEYCESQEFVAECAAGEFVVMSSAMYGRMKIGKCVTSDLGFIGCSADVLPLIDQRCSGRSSCRMNVPDSELDNARPCFRELRMYLEAAYRCVPIAWPSTNICDQPMVIAYPDGYLSAAVTSSTGCGSEQTPYVLRGKPGQRLNLTLLDFEHEQGAETRECVTYGTVREREKTEVRRQFCRSSRRLSHIYTSIGPEVTIELTTSDETAVAGRSLIFFQVLGCPDANATAGVWFRRHNERLAEAGCEGAEVNWTLTCHDQKWSGDPVDCSTVVKRPSKGAEAQLSFWSTESPAIIIGCISVLVSISVVLLGLLVYWSRRKRRSTERSKSVNVSVDEIYSKRCNSASCTYMSLPRNPLYTNYCRTHAPNDTCDYSCGYVLSETDAEPKLDGTSLSPSQMSLPHPPEVYLVHQSDDALVCPCHEGTKTARLANASFVAAPSSQSHQSGRMQQHQQQQQQQQQAASGGNQFNARQQQQPNASQILATSIRQSKVPSRAKTDSAANVRTPAPPSTRDVMM